VRACIHFGDERLDLRAVVGTRQVAQVGAVERARVVTVVELAIRLRDVEQEQRIGERLERATIVGDRGGVLAKIVVRLRRRVEGLRTLGGCRLRRCDRGCRRYCEQRASGE
jgi:hypothetical protein